MQTVKSIGQKEQSFNDLLDNVMLDEVTLEKPVNKNRQRNKKKKMRFKLNTIEVSDLNSNGNTTELKSDLGEVKVQS